MDEKSYREENFSFSNLIVNKSHFLIFELQLQLKKYLKILYFRKIVACVRDRIALLYDQPILPLATFFRVA